MKPEKSLEYPLNLIAQLFASLPTRESKSEVVFGDTVDLLDSIFQCSFTNPIEA